MKYGETDCIIFIKCVTVLIFYFFSLLPILFFLSELPPILNKGSLSQIFIGTVVCTMSYTMVSNWGDNANEWVVSAWFQQDSCTWKKPCHDVGRNYSALCWFLTPTKYWTGSKIKMYFHWEGLSFLRDEERRWWSTWRIHCCLGISALWQTSVFSSPKLFLLTQSTNGAFAENY